MTIDNNQNNQLYNKENSNSFVFKKVKVKKSFAGLGLFADQDIKSGEIILQYIGNILSNKECLSKINKYLFQVNKHITIDGSPRWNIARYINHSCQGNAESYITNKKVLIKAIKDIKTGQEINYDYGEEYVVEYFSKNGCLCNAKNHKYLNKK